ncbi:hypothetical protein FRC12_001237 [Ceratobasidium sp. 428]|nr:hypothetical protein FRC12_001237 [Ceratobasidium sp. 428]
MFAKLKQKLRSSPRAEESDEYTPQDIMRELGKENALSQLSRYDTQFLIDDSRSMKRSRWTEAGNALAGLAATALQYDDDGIEIFLLNAVNAGKTVKTEQDVQQLFASITHSAGTPTGRRLDELLTAYIIRLEAAKQKAGSVDFATTGIKPLNLIVITDGEPSDDPKSVIVAAARRLDTGRFPLTQVGVQFIQVGSDPRASQALRDLDDHISMHNNVRDIVDTRPFTGQPLTSELLITMLLGGINRRVDKLQDF